MKSTLFSVLLSLGLGLNAHALSGHGLSTETPEKFPNVCSISTPEGECSAVLVSSTELYTAAHCLGRYAEQKPNKVHVQCANRNLGTVSSVTVPNPEDTKIWMSDHVPHSDFDFATLTLARETDLAPATISKHSQDYFGADQEILPGVQCYVMGYGLSDEGTGQLSARTEGELRKANLRTVHTIYTRTNVIDLLPLTKAKYLVTSIDRGDSGGGMFCTRNDQDPELVGIIVKYQASPGHLNDTLYRVSNWINGVWGRDSKSK